MRSSSINNNNNNGYLNNMNTNCCSTNNSNQVDSYDSHKMKNEAIFNKHETTHYYNHETTTQHDSNLKQSECNK